MTEKIVKDVQGFPLSRGIYFSERTSRLVFIQDYYPEQGVIRVTYELYPNFDPNLFPFSDSIVDVRTNSFKHFKRLRLRRLLPSELESLMQASQKTTEVIRDYLERGSFTFCKGMHFSTHEDQPKSPQAASSSRC